MPRFYSRRLGGKFFISMYNIAMSDKRLAKKYHARLFKNKSDKSAGRAIGLYSDDLKQLVAIRKAKGLSYADAESGSAKYFDSVKLVEGKADPLKNEISYKSRKYFTASGGKTKEHPDNRVSRAKDKDRFKGTELEFLTMASKGGEHSGKARYKGKGENIVRKHAPKYRGGLTGQKQEERTFDYHQLEFQSKQKPVDIKFKGSEKGEKIIKTDNRMRIPQDKRFTLNEAYYE